MAREALLPCPWCGVVPNMRQLPQYQGGWWHVTCDVGACDVKPWLDRGRSEAEAIAAWNRRIPSPDERLARPAAVPAEAIRALALAWASTAKDLLANLSEYDDGTPAGRQIAREYRQAATLFKGHAADLLKLLEAHNG